MINQGLQISTWTAGLGNHHPFYMAVIDSDGHISFVNSHFLRTFQQISMQPNGKLLISLIHDDYKDSFLDAIYSSFHAEQPATITVKMKNGSGKMVNWELRPFEYSSSPKPKIFCLGYDQPAETKKWPGETKKWLADREPKELQKKLADSIIRAQHQERARIGHELHDNVNQILTSAQLYASCLSRENEDFDFVKHKVIETILLAIEEVRALSHDMVLPDLKGRGVIDCLDKLVADLRYNKHFDIDFRYSDRMTIEAQDPQLKLTLFRIIQEQTKNILKHSHAKKIDISLHAGNDQVRLLIADDGRGFDPKTVTYGLGLSGIKERIELYGGKHALHSAPGKGCALIVTIPLKPRRII